jgi:sugar phosphate permease
MIDKMRNAGNTANNSLTNSRFGKWGWSMIVYSFLLYFFYSGLTTDGLNLLPDAFASTKGWNGNMLLAYATPASLIGIFGSLIFGQIIIKNGAKVTASIALITSGIAYALFGLSPSPVMYAVVLILVCFFASGYGLVVPATLMASWFPKKKGIALGWATIGAPICTAIFVPILSGFLANFGLIFAFVIIGAAVVILGVVSLLWVKDYPEQVGALPDNLPRKSGEKSSQGLMKDYRSSFTIGKLLRDRDMWLISLGFGMLWLVTVGIVSQFVPRMISVGYSQDQALGMLTISAFIACPGSYLWGWLDQKIGTKNTSLIYGISYIIALILLILETGGAIVWIACIFVGMGIGGLLNLMPSLVISVYGRYDFMAVNRLVAPVASIIRVSAFAVMAALLSISGGSYTLPYTAFICFDIVGIILIFCVTNKYKGSTDSDFFGEA